MTAPLFCYPIQLEHDGNGTILATCPDLPEFATYGEDKADALRRAVDALETTLSLYVSKRRDLPRPSRPKGRPLVCPGLIGTMKLVLYQAMREDGLRKADLARRLGCHAMQIDRLLDLTHASRLDQLQAALAALGRRYRISIEKAA